MDAIKKILKNDKKIIESLIISVVTGWMIAAIFAQSNEYIQNLQDYAKNGNLYKALIMFAATTIIMLGINIWYSDISKIIMLISVLAFSFSNVIKVNFVSWGREYKNDMGATLFCLVLAFVSCLAFYYVKDTLFLYMKRIGLKKKGTIAVLIILGFVLFAVVGAIGILRYVTYSNSTYDFGIFTQMYEYMKQTGTINTTLERNYFLSHFGVHFSPIFYIGLPIYYLFSSPITVQLIQALMIALPIIPIYLISKHYKLSNWAILAISAIYVLYPATAGGGNYDIHENCFLTFFVLMTVWTVEKKKNIFFAICGLLACFVKEDAPIILIILGGYYLFSRKDRARGLILIGAAGAYFLLATAIVNSYNLGIMEYRFGNLYYDQDAGLLQVIVTIFTHPSYVIGQAIKNTGDSYDKINYLLLMIAPIAGLIFNTGKKYSRYILLIPLLVINVFTTYLYMHDVNFQYNFGIIALILYLIIMNSADMNNKKRNYNLGIAVICVTMLFGGTIIPKLSYYVEKNNTDKDVIEVLDKAIDTIPEDAVVFASGYFTPHMSKNLQLYDQDHFNNEINAGNVQMLENDMQYTIDMQGDNGKTSKVVKVVPYPDYLVIDNRSAESANKFQSVIQTGKYQSIYKSEGIIEIYKIIE